MIYTFGDSHGLHIPCPEGMQITYHAGASVTMASFAVTKKLLTWMREPIDTSFLQAGDWAVFCFGEIDCRSHICKPENIEKYKEIIDEIVPLYFEAIKENTCKDVKIFVFNVPPPPKLTQEMIEKWGPGSLDPFPFYGTDEDRKRVAVYMNKLLRRYCPWHECVFLDVYNKYIDADGFLPDEYRDAHTHIKDGKYIKEFLECEK